ncbi:ATP-binding cassette domain-containing protein, partial [Rhizobiaceae sp. 2RAB30]
MRGIVKRCPGGVALDVRHGEVLRLIGKSTLMKILSGAYQADAGEIVMDGDGIVRPTPQRMLELV